MHGGKRTPDPRWGIVLLVWIFFFTTGTVRVALTENTPCPSACFCDEATRYVSCVGDELWGFPEEVPRYALRLELRNFVIGTLRAEDFDGLSHLTELILQLSRIRDIENGTFFSLSELHHLDLSQNNLQNLDEGTFLGLEKLRYLDLSTNLISTINGAFSNLSNVEQLNLRENRIRSLDQECFHGLHKVQYLNLDSNNIAAIHAGTFQYLMNLAHLILSNNPLMTLSRLDFFGSRLQYMDVSHVGLTRVPQSLTRFVRDLRLAKNNLTEIRSGDLDSYPYLGLLVLDDNLIEDIEEDALGRLEYLMRLWINGNRLRTVPRSLPPGLRALYLEDNLLHEIRNFDLVGLPNLEQLFLQRNQIRTIEDCAFCELPNLKNLDLQSNRLESVSVRTFDKLTNLETLDLSQNPVKELGARSFASLSRLKMLQLSHLENAVADPSELFLPLARLEILELYNSPELAQRVVSSSETLHALHTLRELNIMHNNLKTLRPDFPDLLPQLRLIKLGNNPWSCDNYTVLWFAHWMKATPTVQFFQVLSVRCVTPPRLASKPIVRLEEADYGLTTTTIQPTTNAKTVPTTFTTSTPPPTTEPFTAQTETPVATTLSTTNVSSVASVAQNTTPTEITNTTATSTTPETTFVSSSFLKTTTSAETTTTEQTMKQSSPKPPSTSRNTLHIIIKPTVMVESSTKSSINPPPATTLTAAKLTSEEDGIPVPADSSLELPASLPATAAKPSVVAAAVSALGLGIAATLVIYRCSHRIIPRWRPSSISYKSHQDEVSIATVADPGITNDLYFQMQDDRSEVW